MRTSRQFFVVAVMLLAALLSRTPAFAQGAADRSSTPIDIVGMWAAGGGNFEEQPLRGDPGVEVGEFVGMPINAAARLHGNSWQPTWASLPEWQNRPHPVTYSMRAPAPNFRLSAVYDPIYQTIIAYKIDGLFGRADRTIWMDGRPHPSKYAEHQYQGFSTGQWKNGVLVVTTSHIKYSFIHRNGLPLSPYAVVTEHFIRHGDLMTHIYFDDDPVYLTEPLLRTSTYRWNPTQNVGRALPSEVVEELATLKRGEVPAYPMGTEHREWSETHKIPYEASLGGAETALPEYQKRLQELMKTQTSAAPAAAPVAKAPAKRTGEGQ